MGANTFSCPPGTDAVPATATQAFNSLRQIVRILRIGDTAAERATGLSSAQLFILQQLTQLSAASINDLADRTLTDQSSVSTVVTRLESKGLVSRARSEADARRVMVTITEAGRQLIQEAPPTVQAQLVCVLQTMPPQALQSFVRELTHVVDALGASHEPPTLFFEDDATGTN